MDKDGLPSTSSSSHSGQIRIDLELCKGLANQANRIVEELNVINGEIQLFEEAHDQLLLKVQTDFGERITSDFPLLSSADLEDVIANLSRTNVEKPKFYFQETLDDLLNYLLIARNDTMDISCFLEAMADQLQERDELLARWINY